MHLSRYGIGCYSFAHPDEVGPPSYRVQDIGKSGVPKLSLEQQRVVKRIQKYQHSTTLRFFWEAGEVGPSATFIVYDATLGPCPASAAHYAVYTYGRNAAYKPGEDAFHLKVMPAFGNETPYPWMTGPPHNIE